MKSINYLVAVATLVTFLAFGCQQSEEFTPSTNFTRTQIVEQIIAHPGSRLDIWGKVSPKNQYEIWVDKIDQILSQDINADWRSQFEELKRSLTYSEYLKGLNSEGGLTLLVEWDVKFGKIATEDERYATIGSLYDYSSESHGIDMERVYEIKNAFDPEKKTTIKISPRTNKPGQNQNCDCKLSNCGFTGQYCCKPWETTGCSQTTVGCGLLWLSSCTHFCVDGYSWNCDDY